VAVLVYVPALGNGFAYDDEVLIAGDPGIRALDGLGERLMKPSWPSSFGEEIGAWRPVTTAVWALTWISSGGSEVAFHLLGVALHAVVTGLGVLVLGAFLAPAAAFLAGLLFAVHPVHVEAVANVAGSAELISGSLLMGALLVHVRGGHPGIAGPDPASGDPRTARYGAFRVVGVTLLYAMAVLAKEGAAVMPLLVLLLDGARGDLERAGTIQYARQRGPLFIALAGVLAMILAWRMDVLGSVAATPHPPGAEVLLDAPRVWTVFSTWPHYLRLLVFPASLASDYGTDVVPIAFGWTPDAVLGAALGLLLFSGALVLWRRGGAVARERPSVRLGALAVLWTAAAILPVANVLYLGPVFVAERTLYVASWGGGRGRGCAARRAPRA
jgi:hypothetical protein